jgi:hypothetical protein
MGYSDTATNSDVDTVIIIIAQQVEIAMHQCEDQQRFKLAFLERLTISLLNNEGGRTQSSSASSRGELADSASVVRLMNRLEARLKPLSHQERCVVIATTAGNLAQEVFPNLIEKYAAALPTLR